VDDPVDEGLVLIGDAAGWIDPLIGQGLAMAMRDTRSIAEVLLEESDWDPAAFASYADERRQRLAILALNARVHQHLDVDFSPSFSPLRLEVAEKTYEDELFQSLLGTQIRGPEYADPRVLEATERARLSAMIGAVV
jgi:2-polyprenyl-6-methoxyphenol hydroxylase-like FAD-dependent oxidoreductase